MGELPPFSDQKPSSEKKDARYEATKRRLHEAGGFEDFLERLHTLEEERAMPLNATPAQQFEVLVRSLRGSMQREIISGVDSDAAALADFLVDHPELSSSKEELEMRLDILGGIVNTAWRAPGWERSLAQLQNPRLDTTDQSRLLT